MIVLGRITAPYGVKGWLRLHPFGDDPGSWGEMSYWWLGRDDQDFSGWQSFPLDSLRAHGKAWVAKLVGVDDRSTAESLVGSFVGAPREVLPATAVDEYYWADLVGLAVENLKQEALGRVIELIESGAHSVVVVQEAEGDAVRQRLLPFVGQVVKAVDVPAGVMRVDWEKDW